MQPEDNESRNRLLKRIKGYRDSESWVRVRYEELKVDLATIEARRLRAEELYELEYGQPAPEKIKLPLGENSPATAEAEIPETDGPLGSMSWFEAITTVLQEHGPMHVKEIWAHLQDGGFQTTSRDPVRSIVATVVRRSPDIVRVGVNRFGLPGQEISDEQTSQGEARAKGDKKV